MRLFPLLALLAALPAGAVTQYDDLATCSAAIGGHELETLDLAPNATTRLEADRSP